MNKPELKIIDIKFAESATYVEGEFVSGNMYPFELQGEWVTAIFNGRGFDEESAFFRFVESDDLLEWTNVGDGFNPTNDMLNYSIKFSHKKNNLALLLVTKDEATKGFLTIMVESK